MMTVMAPSVGHRPARNDPKLKQWAGKDLQEKYGLHDALKALLPKGERTARSVKAAGRRAWVSLPACSKNSSVWDADQLPALSPDVERAHPVC